MSLPLLAQSFVSPETPVSEKYSKDLACQSKLVSAAPSARSTHQTSSAVSVPAEDDILMNQNPFKMVAEEDLFFLRDKDRAQRKAEQAQQKNLKIHQKITYAARINARRASLRRMLQEDDEKEDLENSQQKTHMDKIMELQEDRSWKIAVTKDRQIKKESLKEYIDRKRELFRLQYSLVVKRDEMNKLELQTAVEEAELEKAERFLEDDAALFDEFLKENDKNSVDALKIAERETKAKLEKVLEIKALTAQMMAVKSDISKYEDILKEYMMYQEFLIKLSPKEWQEEWEKKQEERKKNKVVCKKKEKDDRATQSPASLKGPDNRVSSQTVQAKEGRGFSRQSTKTSANRRQSTMNSPADGKDTSSSDSEEEPELYFTDPYQLLNIFTELEEQNLSLIQNTQETEETLEDIRMALLHSEHKMNRETKLLQEQTQQLLILIEKEKAQAAELELKSRIFSFGQGKGEDQDKMLELLNKKVEDVYRSCVTNNPANLTTLQMLTSIENHLEELFDKIELIPPDRLEAAEKAKEKERRLRLREEKLKQQKLHQEERLRRALERAQADPKKKAGRKLMFRSEPPALKQAEDKNQETIDREKEEHLYFFT
ncbi:cilia- and flagella-associated protein 100 [Latimeria chalumnae]|uniref:cilia- and flagella-associated protein 100 n=1 Tax=Latimeria chalumnae TaxID=7897 RepID=UPI00313E7361